MAKDFQQLPEMSSTVKVEENPQCMYGNIEDTVMSH